MSTIRALFYFVAVKYQPILPTPFRITSQPSNDYHDINGPTQKNMGKAFS